MRGIGDFASGDQLTQLDRGRTESPAHEAIFGDAEHRGINLNFFEMNRAAQLFALPSFRASGNAIPEARTPDSVNPAWFEPLRDFLL